VKYLPLLFLLFILGTNKKAISQKNELSVAKWAKTLADPDGKFVAYKNLTDKLFKLDSITARNFISELEKYPKEKGHYFWARIYYLKAAYVFNYRYTPNINDPVFKKNVNDISSLMLKALQQAYESNDTYLAAGVSILYGYYMSDFLETDLAVMYLMNASELYEKAGNPPDSIYYAYMTLSGLLWKVKEYESSIHYASKAINALKPQTYKQNPERDIDIISTYNTIALCYKNRHLYDTAFFYFQKGLDIEKKINNPTWEGLISGNMAQIYFVQGSYQKALPLFMMDYTNSLQRREYDNAANSLQWAARTHLKLGNKTLALQQTREAYNLLHKRPNPNYLQNVYFTSSEIFKKLGNMDSLIYYSGLYNNLHDSLEMVIYRSSVNIVTLRLDDQKSRYDIMNLQRERQEQEQQRNIIIAGILLLSAIALFTINRKRQQWKHKQQIAIKDKEHAEKEMASAKAQLKLFRQNIIEKTNIIEKLEDQLNQKEMSVEDQQLISELTQQTILTEEDWDKFKSLFVQIFPLFFQNLKNNAADITVAEQRMAALTRLQLTTRQMASILGISIGSVNKTRQRLRKRIGLSNDDNLEEYIVAI
jgi:DNA-binding CsgD family transcriptional regulator